MPNKYDILRSQDSGFFQDLILRVKLILRLMGDRRVSPLLKLLPIGALIYLVSPVDLLPGLVLPFLGAIDDAAVIWLGATLFVNLCPEDVIQEHMNALQKVVNAAWKEAPKVPETGDIIEAEAQEASEDDK
jgi:uncharacterized membrane protein YkvA (DUF1232 family)